MSGMSYGAVLSLILQKIGGIPLIPSFKVRIEGAPPTKQIIMSGLMGMIPGASMLSGALGALSGGLSGALSSVTSSLASSFTNPISSLSDKITSGIPNLGLRLSAGGSPTGGIDNTVTALLSAAADNILTYEEVNAITVLLNGNTYDPDPDVLPVHVTSNHIGNSLSTLLTLTSRMTGVSPPNFSAETGTGTVSVLNTINYPQVIGTLNSLQEAKSNVSSSIDAQYHITTVVTNAINGIVDPFSDSTNESLNNFATLLSDLQTSADAGTITHTMATNSVSQITGYKTLIDNLYNNAINSLSVTLVGMDGMNYLSAVHSTLSSTSSMGNLPNPAYNFINKTCNPSTLSAMHTAVPPFISSISPVTGSIEGGTSITINGGYFCNINDVNEVYVNKVQFNLNDATSFTVINSNTIHAVSPKSDYPIQSYVIIYSDGGASSGAGDTNIFTYTG